MKVFNVSCRVVLPALVASIVICCTVTGFASENSMSDRDFIFYNIAPYSPGKEKELAADMKEYSARTGNKVVLYSLTLHPQGLPAMKKAGELIESYRKLKKELEGSDVRLGVLLQSLIGHWPRVDADEEPWTRTVNIEGKAVRYCVLDQDFRNYISTIVKQLAKESPSFVMSDDDVRWFSPKAECFCKLHTAEFNRRTSQGLTSAEYRKLVAESKTGDATYNAYLQLQRDSINGLAKLVREAIDSVDPSIPAGACMPGWDLRYCGETAQAIAGNTPTVLRIANAMYSEWTAKNLPQNVLRSQALKQYHSNISRVLDESDTYPHTLYSRSSKGMHAKLCTSIMSGLRGAKIWYINSMKRAFKVSRNYTDILAANKGLYQTLAKEIKDSEPSGVIIPLHRDFPSWHPVRPYSSFFIDKPSWSDVFCGAYGIPFHASFNLSKNGVYMLAGAKNVNRFSDEELKKLLSGKLLIDGAAATALEKRGFGAYTGVKAELKPFKYTIEAYSKNKKVLPVDKSDSVPLLTITDNKAEVMTKFYYEQWSQKGLDTEVAPATVIYRNSLGGIVCTTANCVATGKTNSLNDARKGWLLDILDKLNGKQLPYTVVGEQEILALSAETRSKETLLGVFNLNFDKMNTIQIRCAAAPSQVQLLKGDGTWQNLTFQQNNGVISLPISLECYDCALLKLTP